MMRFHCLFLHQGVKVFDIFLTFPSNIDYGCLGEAVLTSTSNLCFGAYPSVTTQKWGVRGYSIHGHVILIKFQCVCEGGGAYNGSSGVVSG